MGFITLLSDLGNNDASVAGVKGLLMQQLPGTDIIDASHNIRPFYLQHAAYLLASTLTHFPQGTFHLVIYDMYYSSTPRYVIAETKGQFILAPDNGIIPLALRSEMVDAGKWHEQSTDSTLAEILTTAANTIRSINENNTPLSSYETIRLYNAPLPTKMRIYDTYVECHVIHIDRFENVVLNITKQEFETAANGRAFSINFIRDEEISIINNHYNAVNPGDKLCRFNSAGYLEIAINGGNAAGLFGLKMMQEENLLFNKIKISFE